MPEESNHLHPVDSVAAVEYTCPMHPEVLQSEPGNCPKCGMFLVPREAATEAEHEHHDTAQSTAVEYTCPMHPEVVQNEPGKCPKCGMFLVPRETSAETANEEHHDTAQNAAVEYTCPMHPEVVQNEPGSCPKCGMTLLPRDESAETGHDHASMDHSTMSYDEMAFMSMIDVTRDLPRSPDGLPMDWIDVPFGPFFPGLPGGLLLTLTLDGDTVADASTETLTDTFDLLQDATLDAVSFVEQLTAAQPLSPLAYRILACRAIENAAGIEHPAAITEQRIATLERERICSHLGWLSLFAEQVGLSSFMRQAASLQLQCQQADYQQLFALRPDVNKLIKRLLQTPLLKSRTVGIGSLIDDIALQGPVARAAGIENDSRCADPHYMALGFKPVTQKAGDTFARLCVRLDEIKHSFSLLEAADSFKPVTLMSNTESSGKGEAVIETPRGQARLKLQLENGQVSNISLETPSTYHHTLINSLTDQQELGDALITVGSLDLSPWEIQP